MSNPFCKDDSCPHVHHDCNVIGCHGEPDQTYLRAEQFRSPAYTQGMTIFSAACRKYEGRTHHSTEQVWCRCLESKEGTPVN